MSYIVFAGFSVQHQEVQQFADCSNPLCGRLNTCTSWLLKFHVWVNLMSEAKQKWHFLNVFTVQHRNPRISNTNSFALCLRHFQQFTHRHVYLELNSNPCTDWKQRFLTLCWFLFIYFCLQSTKGVFDQFPVFLASATKEQPLVILLDSLNQLCGHISGAEQTASESLPWMRGVSLFNEYTKRPF